LCTPSYFLICTLQLGQIYFISFSFIVPHHHYHYRDYTIITEGKAGKEEKENTEKKNIVLERKHKYVIESLFSKCHLKNHSKRYYIYFKRLIPKILFKNNYSKKYFVPFKNFILKILFQKILSR